MDPDKLARIIERHDADDLELSPEPNTKDYQKVHHDRGDLIEEVERLQSNFEIVIAFLQGFLDHYGNYYPQDMVQRIRQTTNEARGLR